MEEASAPQITWHMVEAFRHYPRPVTIEVDHSGLGKTKFSVVEEHLEPLKGASTVQEYLELVDKAYAHWTSLGIFKNVTFEIGPLEHEAKQGFKVHVKFEEGLQQSAGLFLHQRKGVLIPFFQHSFMNLFGRAWVGQVYSGLAGSRAFADRNLFGVRLGGWNRWLGGENSLTLFRRTTPDRGSQEIVRHMQCSLKTLDSEGWTNELSAGVVQRESTLQPERTTGAETGIAYKAYLNQGWIYDAVVEVVNPLTSEFGMPVGGQSLEVDVEVSALHETNATLNYMIKNEFKSQWYIPLFSAPAWTLNIVDKPPNSRRKNPEGGATNNVVTATVEPSSRFAILGLFFKSGLAFCTKGRVPQSDRFVLGDNAIRSYRAIGPGIPRPRRSGEEREPQSLPRETGGNAMACACVNLSMPIPQLLPDGLTFAHCFINAGNLDYIPGPRSMTLNWLTNFVRDAKASVGCGFVFAYLPFLGHFGRLEANISLPLDARGRPFRPADDHVFERYKLGLTWTTDGSIPLYPSSQ